jgi:archaellum component FlaG (FlaF/FlaG flagellin family)
MKKCRSCKSDIDDKATKCPFCQTDQRNWFRRHPIITIFVVLFLIGVIGGASGNKSKSSVSENKGASTESVVQDSQNELVARINEEVVDKDMAFTVNEVITVDSLGSNYINKNAQGVFYVITLTVKNNGGDTKTIDSSQFQIVDGQGRKYDRSIDGQTAKGLSQGHVDLFLQQIQPSLSVTGDLVFDVAKDATDLKLLVKDNIFSKGKMIDLSR